MLQQMGPVPIQLYRDTGLSHKRRDYLISLCNQMKLLKAEDLEACTALVIHQLQIDTRRSLHKEINSDLDQKEERTISASLREHLLGHISFLKERGILKGGIPAGFANVLMLHDEMKSQQANLNTAGGLNTPTSLSSTDEQSSNLLKRDQMVDGYYNHTVKHKDCKIKSQDDTSSCEDDSRDGKFGEKKRVPGIAQNNTTLRGISRNEQSSEGSLSSKEQSPVHRKENASTVATNLMDNKGPNNIKSKAFWGESDDSSSDIEAILRPQTNHVEGDDFDDFFD
ncbi:hypothetical protein GDO78_009914 [Eleutherodactylus coqui]|uniref:Centrosomal protein kizuna n=1 Tax=Eleutherodactylus coqui TaxID=57060 RepID=A0A8J6F9D7_ELECQ|nr:hypothetical protein GDO78_009914 [Eleutherodactylus coqui]